MDLIDNKSDMIKKLNEHLKKVDAIRKLPEYEEYLKYKEELDGFVEYINKKRIDKTYEFLREIIEDKKSE